MPTTTLHTLYYYINIIYCRHGTDYSRSVVLATWESNDNDPGDKSACLSNHIKKDGEFSFSYWELKVKLDKLNC